ncbi:hypothetical protein COTS27_00206 [Spirochaetota bacterium]|nr:hypothetical protein COTS27_00206 [Spirochaetota bacterium]
MADNVKMVKSLQETKSAPAKKVTEATYRMQAPTLRQNAHKEPFSTLQNSNTLQNFLQAIDNIFTNYPYRRYQHKFTKIDLATLGAFFRENFLTQRYAWVVTREQLVKELQLLTDSKPISTDNHSDHPVLTDSKPIITSTADIKELFQIAENASKEQQSQQHSAQQSNVKYNASAPPLNFSDRVIGIGSLKPFALLSNVLKKEVYLLKDFFIATYEQEMNRQEMTDRTAKKANFDVNVEEKAYHILWQNMLKAMSGGRKNNLPADSLPVNNLSANNLPVSTLTETNDGSEQAAIKSNPQFIVTRLPSENTVAINALLNNGFYYVASETIYTLVLAEEDPFPAILKRDLACINDLAWKEPDLSFRLAHLADLPALTALVAKTTFPTRYSYDNHFTSDMVQQIYQETLKQSFQLDNHYVCLCEMNVKGDRVPIGFVSFIVNNSLSQITNKGWGSLDYIIVDAAYRKNGLATLLNAWAIKFLSCLGVRIFQVKTLTQNYPSTALLMRSGFSATASNVLLHNSLS